ncbi:protein SUPPRESSOR OF FRI 4 isoform X2 [Rhizophagus clarus]|uniref:Protein SUPPRESSOR OF FRI 4 isoform X2 n=1 Tax=Rhizophagus clarus TaxID=94130 RepID=A0A8H3QEN4_9GLOM|nr:protein SUPPRESSOR OF FRI 4 isoform X2 [Rhizophagus clarus]
MGKKKNKKVVRPWCWYCERDFEDEKVLIQHQKAKHFKCPHCNKKLNTAGGMVVHVAQVHKETIDTVPNALKGRESTDVEIFGMEGIPQADMIAHMHALETDQPTKKIKTEEPMELSSEEIKKQLAQHQAMMQNSSTTGQPYPYSGYSTTQQNMPSLMPHQYSQFYQRPGANSAQTYSPVAPYRPNQIPGQSLPVIPGQPWRPPVSGVSQSLYGQIQPATTGQSAIYPSRPTNSVSSASQIYPQVPHATVPGMSPSVPSVGDTMVTNDSTTNIIQSTIQQTAQKTVPKVVLVYSDNEVSMEEKRAELEKYRYNEDQFRQQSSMF